MNEVSAGQIFVLLIVAAAGLGVVLTRDVADQVIGVSFFGLTLALMFLILHAPDVALSQLIVGAVALPLMLLLTLAKLRRSHMRRGRR